MVRGMQSMSLESSQVTSLEILLVGLKKDGEQVILLLQQLVALQEALLTEMEVPT